MSVTAGGGLTAEVRHPAMLKREVKSFDEGERGEPVGYSALNLHYGASSTGSNSVLINANAQRRMNMANLSEVDILCLRPFLQLIQKRILKKRQASVITLDSPWKLAWELLCFFLLAYLMIITPIRLSFFDANNFPLNLIFDYLCDFIFMVDILLKARYFCVLDPIDGSILYRKHEIWDHYKKGDFFVDIMAHFPINIIGYAFTHKPMMVVYALRFNLYIKLWTVFKSFEVLERLSGFIRDITLVRCSRILCRDMTEGEGRDDGAT
jgi:hypothetical protein